jgi:hypothetical protein
MVQNWRARRRVLSIGQLWVMRMLGIKGWSKLGTVIRGNEPTEHRFLLTIWRMVIWINNVWLQSWRNVKEMTWFDLQTCLTIGCVVGYSWLCLLLPSWTSVINWMDWLYERSSCWSAGLLGKLLRNGQCCITLTVLRRLLSGSNSQQLS